MLSTRVIMPLALASLAFMWGCQEQTSSPTGPEGPGILLDKDGIHPHGGGTVDNPVDGTFDARVDGDVASVDGDDGIFHLQGPHGGKNVLQEKFGMFAKLNLPGLLGSNSDLVINGDKCFSSGGFPSGMQVGQVTPSNTEAAIIHFFFDAKGTNGTSDVNYVLTVHATFIGTFINGTEESVVTWPPPPPPAEGTSKTTIGAPASFVLAHSNGPGNKVACTGEGPLGDDDTFTFELTVKRT